MNTKYICEHKVDIRYRNNSLRKVELPCIPIVNVFINQLHKYRIY